MPFTFCHPAIVLPFAKWGKNYLSATGLIIGSMAPDFEYFLKMRLEKVHGHTFEGIFYFDLPLTLLLAVIFHRYVRDALIKNLPELLQKRLSPYIGYNWFNWLKKRWYVLVYSALIGIFSHFFWDAFTHTDGYFVQRIPALQGSAEILGVTMRKADIGQLVSSAFGALFILAVLVWPFKEELASRLLKRKITYWFLVLLITSLVLLIRNGSGTGDFIATSISGGLIGLILTPSIMKRLNKYKEWEKIEHQL